MLTPQAKPETLEAIARAAATAGIERIHMFAWRDLDDVEAGGSEVHAHCVASIWAQAGLNVVHRTSFAPGHPQQAGRAGYEVVRKAGRYMVFPRTVLAELAGRNGSRDALVEIWNGVPYLSPLWCSGPRMVWLHHVHGPMWAMSLPDTLAKAGVLLEERIAPKLYRRTPIVTLSNSSREELVTDLGFSRANVTVVSPGVDPKFSPGGTKSPTPLICSVGRLVPVKDFPRLVRIMAAVRARVPEARLVIVGEGYEREAIQAQIDSLGATNFIYLAGRISDAALINLYRMAWVTTSTSIREGWGMTMTEAAACGTPSVATAIAGHADAVLEGVSGLLGTTDAELTEHLVAVCTDAVLRERLSKGAAERAGQLTWDATAIDTFAVLAADAKRRSGSRK
ncbi:MAG TPA: glycosyltransferase family 1 protein [Acidimicrobiaceae bacterium]|nr:glycosyltransferase family 1 protein [Acidimicrobiaceae bacterium]